MGWDAGLNRKLAVPIALGNLQDSCASRTTVTRILKDEDPEDLKMLLRIAENRDRLHRLAQGFDADFEIDESDDLANELDYVEASVQLGLLEITGELEEIQSSEEVFEEVALA